MVKVIISSTKIKKPLQFRLKMGKLMSNKKASAAESKAYKTRFDEKTIIFPKHYPHLIHTAANKQTIGT